jgi:murein DD-endopeptidase MepM/ murein hydrolase activator NlpD
MVQNLGNFFNGLTGVLSAIGQNILEFDFMDESKRFETAVDYMTNSFDLMKGNIDSAFNILKEPIDYTPLEQAAAGAGEEQVAQEQTQEGGTTTTTAGPSMTYSSQGGQRIVDVGGQDYGDYGAGGIGSRGNARVHGAGGERGHTGEDYSLPIGKPLTMIAKGTVVDVGLGYNGGYGNFVVVQLDNGMYVKMAHLDKVYVKKGQRVGAGSAGGGRAVVIGTSGNSGLSTGPHLHLDYARSYNPSSAMVSQTSNPKNFIEGGGLVIGSNVKSSGQVTTTSASTSTQGGTQQQSVGRGKLSPKQIAQVARQAGIPEDKIPTMVAIAMAESGGNSNAHNPKYPDNSFGLWQINMLDEPGYMLGAERRQRYGLTSNDQLKDPLTNARAALDILNSQGLSAWSVYKSGKYRDYLPDAQAAVSSTPRTAPNLQLPSGGDSINVPMPAGQSQQQSGSSSSGGGFMGAVNDAGQALNRFITERFLNNL